MALRLNISIFDCHIFYVSYIIWLNDVKAKVIFQIRIVGKKYVSIHGCTPNISFPLLFFNVINGVLVVKEVHNLFTIR